MIEVPGPEPDWEHAATPWPMNPNPALQNSMWEYITADFRLVATLSPSLDALAARLRLNTERSWEDGLGPVDAAMFRIGRVHFALSRNEGSPRPDAKVWVSRDQTDVDAALGVLLEALGIGWEALTWRDPEAGYVDLRADPGM